LDRPFLYTAKQAQMRIYCFSARHQIDEMTREQQLVRRTKKMSVSSSVKQRLLGVSIPHDGGHQPIDPELVKESKGDAHPQYY